jgi:hypothetical protein
MFGFMRKRVTRPQEAASTEEMKQEQDLLRAHSPDEKPKYSYRNSFELPGQVIYHTADARDEKE